MSVNIGGTRCRYCGRQVGHPCDGSDNILRSDNIECLRAIITELQYAYDDVRDKLPVVDVELICAENELRYAQEKYDEIKEVYLKYARTEISLANRLNEARWKINVIGKGCG